MPAAVKPTAPVSCTSLPDTDTHKIPPSTAPIGIRYLEVTISDHRVTIRFRGRHPNQA